MLVYIICIIALLLAIRYEYYLNSPCMDKALGELEELGFEFGTHQWCGCDNMSAIAIDRQKEKICLIRAYKGWQQIDFDDLVELDMEDKKIKPHRGLFGSIFARKVHDNWQSIAVHIIINNIDCYNFSLIVYRGGHPEKIKNAQKEAREILTVLKLLKITAEKKQRQVQVAGKPSRRNVGDNPAQQKFNFQ